MVGETISMPTTDDLTVNNCDKCKEANLRHLDASTAAKVVREGKVGVGVRQGYDAFETPNPHL